MQSTTAVFLWKKGRLNDIAEITMGQSPDGSSYNFHGEGIGLINGPTEFTNKYPVVRQWTTKPTKLCRPGDILLCVRGSSTGRMNLSDAKYCIGRGVASISAKEGKGVTGFLYYLLDYKISQLLKKTAGTTFPNLSSDEIRNVEISIPSLEEQHKIADILSTWDKAIELKEKMIEQKKEQKKGLMQRLLMRQVRLPGFEGEWKEVRLGDLGDLYQPQTISQSEFLEEGYPVYGANGLIGYYSKYNHENWQIMITCRGSTCGTVNRSVEKSWITGNAMVLNLDNNPSVDKEFIYYLCLNQNFQTIIEGSGQPQITRKPLANFRVYIPDNLEEQKMIAMILSTADKQIELAEQELEALKQQKKGLMQLLLTGKVRVKC